MVFNRNFAKNNAGFLIVIGGVVILSVLVVTLAICCSGSKIVFSANYYFVCMYSADNSVSASSLSGTVSDFGGAGYVLKHNDSYYVTVSCYYNENDAITVNDNLKKRGLNCIILNVEVNDFKVPSSAKKNSELYLGNLNTLSSLASLAYECANNLDTGEYGQNQAKNVVTAISNGLNGLKNANAFNCFYEDFSRLVCECEDVAYGYVYSKDLRYLQIAITDAIINCRIY